MMTAHIATPTLTGDDLAGHAFAEAVLGTVLRDRLSSTAWC